MIKKGIIVLVCFMLGLMGLSCIPVTMRSSATSASTEVKLNAEIGTPYVSVMNGTAVAGAAVIIDRYISSLADENTVEEEVVGDKPFPTESMEEMDQQHVCYLSGLYGVPRQIVMALASVESDYDPNAVSTTNDYGMCQINSINHGWLSDELGRNVDYFNSYDSIESCCYMLAYFKNRHPNDGWHYILMCYNMGEGGAAKAARAGYFSTIYSRKIMTKAYELGYTE